MTVELRPLGVKCNIQCQYCYQNPQRDAGNIAKSYDLDLMKKAIQESGQPFSLFGGEALLIPENDLEDLWSWGFQQYGRNDIQTNGILINENHIRMFRAYNVRVGISIDGPGELNDIRWAGTLKKTRENTQRTEAAIEKLCNSGIPPSLIVTLHRNNATSDKLPLMGDWFKYLENIGITSARLHLLEVETEVIRKKYSLTPEENIDALFFFANVEKALSSLKLDVFKDMRQMLLGQDNHTTCVWNACDPYTTRAVQGVEGFGQKSNCGRTNKDGIDFVKADRPGYERYIALHQIPQEAGGCKGCRFFLMCKGQCPGTALNEDWRNRSEHCSVWMKLFEAFESDYVSIGQVPISLHPNRSQIEGIVLSAWREGDNISIESALQLLDIRS